METVVAISEWVTYGPQPEKTRRNCASVGEKMNLGGQVWAADSGLNAVSTIHSTGRKNAIPTTHARTPQPTFPAISRNLCGRGFTVPHRHGGRHHAPASSNWKTRANIRSANVATMMVRMTVTTPVAAAPPMSNALFTCWNR